MNIPSRIQGVGYHWQIMKRILGNTALVLTLLAAVHGCARQESGPGRLPVVSQVRESADPHNSIPDLDCSYSAFLQARYAELDGRYEEALQRYEQALACDPDAEYITARLPLLLLRLNRTDEARKRLQAYLQTHPDNTGARLLLARIFIRSQRYDEAARQYRLIHEAEPKETQALLLESELYLALKRLDQAKETLSRVLAIDPDNYSAHLLLARICRQQKLFDKAARQYRRALALNWSPDLALELGDLYLKTREYDRAVALYTRVLEQENDNEQASIALIHVYLQQGREDAALAELKRLKTVTERPLRVELSMARLYARRGQYRKARSILEDILKTEDLPQAHYLLGLLFFQQKHHDQALREFEQVVPEAAEYEDSVFLRVRLLRILERPEEAIALLRKVVEEKTIDNPDLYLLLAGLYQERQQTDRARQVFAEALKRYPDQGRLLYEYGLFLDQIGEPQQAMEIMHKVLVLEPEHAAALNYIGYTWADQKKNLRQALQYIQRAVKLKPDNGYIRDSLGWVYYRLGDLQRALKELRHALRLAPDDPAILDHLGDVYLESGAQDKALDAYRKALKLFTESSEQERVRQKIRIITGKQ